MLSSWRWDGEAVEGYLRSSGTRSSLADSVGQHENDVTNGNVKYGSENSGAYRLRALPEWRPTPPAPLELSGSDPDGR